MPSSATSSAKSTPRTEETTISQIRSEMDKIRTKLQPDVDTFLQSLNSPSASATTTSTAQAPQSASGAKQQKRQQPAPKQQQRETTPQTDLEQEHARLGELLLQSLLRLDAIHSEGEWEQARKERKGAVKEVQALLDRLDGGWRARAKA